MDIVASENTPVYAIADGNVTYKTVTRIDNGDTVYKSYGAYALLNFDGGFAKYAHLSKFGEDAVSPYKSIFERSSENGKTTSTISTKPINKGDIIGYVGSTGRSTDPHLHFGLWLDGNNVDPREHVDFSGIK